MRLFSVFLAMALLAAPAHAVTVRNLSDSTQAVIVEQGSGRHELILPPGGVRYYTGGAVILTVSGQRPVRADFQDEYAIWPDGKLIIQRRQKTKGTSR